MQIGATCKDGILVGIKENTSYMLKDGKITEDKSPNPHEILPPPIFSIGDTVTTKGGSTFTIGSIRATEHGWKYDSAKGQDSYINWTERMLTLADLIDVGTVIRNGNNNQSCYRIHDKAEADEKARTFDPAHEKVVLQPCPYKRKDKITFAGREEIIYNVNLATCPYRWSILTESGLYTTANAISISLGAKPAMSVPTDIPQTDIQINFFSLGE